MSFDEEKEVKLIDCLLVIRKFAVFISIGVILFMVISLGRGLTLPKIYEVHSVVEVALSEGLADTMAKIQFVFKEKSLKEIGNIQGFSHNVKLKNPVGTNLLYITTKSTKPEKSVLYLENIVALILKEDKLRTEGIKADIKHKVSVLDLAIKGLQSRKKILSKNSSILEVQRKNTREQIETVSKRLKEYLSEKKTIYSNGNLDNSLGLFIYTNEIQSLQQYHNQLQDKMAGILAQRELDLLNERNQLDDEIKKNELKRQNLQLQILDIKEAKVLREPLKPLRPVPSTLIQNTFLSGFVGFILFVSLAFLRNYISTVKAK